MMQVDVSILSLDSDRSFRLLSISSKLQSRFSKEGVVERRFPA